MGDLLLGHDGEWIAVESQGERRSVETVYNLRVEDFHTYFVGCDEWGFSVWAHNACVYHYGDPGIGVLGVGTWVTYSGNLRYDQALLITTKFRGPIMSRYEFDEDLGLIDWNPWPVNGHRQGQTTVPVGVPPAVETNVPRP